MESAMSQENRLLSKVLVLEDQAVYANSLKHFYRESGLICIRPQQNCAESVMPILRSNVDLGGIMLYQNFGGETQGLALAREIHASRPELPIFLRRDSVASVEGLSEGDVQMLRCVYTLDDLPLLARSLEASIFSRIYPNDLVRGITEMTQHSLATLFPHCAISAQTPYLAVKDPIIYGEMFTLIAIESHWCRGYMMLQVEEDAMMALLPRGNGDEARSLTFRELNSILGEATNLVWGSFRNRYAGDGGQHNPLMQTQVPIIVNHQRRYISFGSDDAQLCLNYVLQEKDNPDAAPVTLVQRFVFNLSWSPGDFSENPTVESLMEAGELELF
jgi:hypothetical protein